MATFDIEGNYELRFTDHSGTRCRSMIAATDDDDALTLARATRYPGLSLEVWQNARLIEQFATLPRAVELEGRSFSPA